MERQSGEGGTPAVLNPLALAYHFGWVTSTPDEPEEMVQKHSCDIHTGGNEAMSAPTPMEACPRMKRGVLSPARSRPSVITGRRPQTAIEKNGAKRDRADNIILERSTTPSFGDVRGFIPIKKLNLAQSGASPCVVFLQKGKNKLKLLPTLAEAPENVLASPAHPPAHTAVLVKGGTTVSNQQLDCTPQAENTTEESLRFARALESLGKQN